MNHLYLIRHGENLANLTLEFSHRKVDYSLTPKGILQAQQTADYLSNRPIQEIYSSPLKRAYETAEIIARPLHLPVQVVEAFREVNVGDLEGQKPTAALWGQHNAIIDSWNNGSPEACFPGGEDYPTLLGRIQSGLVEILTGKDNRHIAIVAHGGLFAFTLRDLCSGIDKTIIDQGIANCSITEMEARLVNGRLEARMLAFATRDHLRGEAANLVTGIFPVDEIAGAEPGLDRAP